MKRTIKLFPLSIFLLMIGLMACNITVDKEVDASEDKEQAEEVKNLEEALNKTKDALNDIWSDGEKDGETVEVYNWRELKDLLPNRLGGLKLDDTEGQTTGVMGFKLSNTTGKYESNDARMDVNIIDFGGVGFLVKTVASWSELEIDTDSSDGYQKTIDYKGYKAMEQYNERNKSGSFAVLVEDRFVVTIDGDGIDMDDLKDAIDDIGIRKLARMAEK